MTEAEILDVLVKRYPEPAWAFIPHVPNATGAVATRTADAMAMSLWPSRGLELHGFEIKCSRSDWLRELKTPHKADPLFAYCDRWWVVTPKVRKGFNAGPDIVEDGELPPTWGLLRIDGGKCAVHVEAPKLAPKPLDRKFLAAILRRAWEQKVSKPQIDEARRAGWAEGHEEAGKQFDVERRMFHEFQETVRKFEAAAGISVGHSWDSERIGAIVNQLSSNPEGVVNQLDRMRHNILDVLTHIESALGAAQRLREKGVCSDGADDVGNGNEGVRALAARPAVRTTRPVETSRR